MDKQKKSVQIDLSSDSDEKRNSWKSLMASIFYVTMSTSTGIITKGLMNAYEFDYPLFIMAMQMAFTIAVLELLAVFQVISLPTYSTKRGASFAAPTIFYGFNSILALSALSHMNLAMYGVIKRCVPLSVMFFSVVFLKKGWPNKQTSFAVVSMTVGCIIAGYGDLGFDAIAYICGVSSNFTHATYLLLVQRHSTISTAEKVQLNCYNNLPVFLLIVILKGDIPQVLEYPYLHDFKFIALFMTTLTAGMLLNYSLFLCASMTSALTTSVMGGLKAVIQTIIGFIAFGGVSHNISTYLGISMNLSGGIGYIWIKYKENNAKSDSRTEKEATDQTESVKNNRNGL